MIETLKLQIDKYKKELKRLNDKIHETSLSYR
jgi:hypothetical protein